MKKIFSIIILILAILGLALSFIPINIHTNVKAPKQAGHLKEFIPAKAGRFVATEKPLGNTEELVRATEKYLSVSEYLNYSYSDSDKTEFTVYISYWGEGKESTIRASAHTPDRCWVENGWKNLEEKKRFNEVFYVGANQIMPAYYREMLYKNGNAISKRNVLFWFVVNGQRYDYGTSDNAIPSLKKYFENMVKDAFTVSPECYFVRIDSSSDLYSLMQDKDFLQVMDSLGKLILYQKK